MKKRILLIALVICMALTLCSCDLGKDDAKTYVYDSIDSPYEAEGQDELLETMESVYEKTHLKISEDGTWSVEMNIFWFVNTDIDEGTYKEEGGRYIFEGFDYGINAYGYETEDGFDFVFHMSEDEALDNFVVLHFVEEE